MSRNSHKPPPARYRWAEEGDYDDLQLPLGDVAFDEMNLSMIPIGVLSNRKPETTRIDLTTDGRRQLVFSGDPQKHGIPTALADQAVLGLMWLTQRQNGFQSRTIRFDLRDLVCNYIYPGKYESYNVGQRALKAVENQLFCVAHTRIVSDAWHDHRLGKTTKIDAAIIDYIQIIEEGGRNKRRVLEIAWGQKFYESVVARYTKPIDPHLLALLEHPLDRRLYRYVDQQLTPKQVQRIKSCQDFARGVLLMQGQKVAAGGRTASGYIAKRLKESLRRLDQRGFRVLGFRVRLEINAAPDDFSMKFVRLDTADVSEVVVEDLPGRMVREFQHHFHGVRKTGEGRLRKADRETAERWVADYGYEKAAWMVARCKKLHAANPRRAGETIYYLAGLEPYESAAAGAYDAERVEREGQLKLDLEEHRGVLWKRYRQACLELAAERFDPEDMQQQAERIARETSPESFRLGSPRVEKTTIAEALETLAMERIGALSEDEFRAAGALDAALVERHGTNPVAASSNDPD